MRKTLCIGFALLIVLTARLPASGKQEEKEVLTQKDEWVLCITGINTRGLPEERRQIGEVVSVTLTDGLSNVNRRARVSPEYAYYEQRAWSDQRAAAARALSEKQAERSALIYRGDPEWKYKKNLAVIDADIETLRANLYEIDNTPPLINSEPLFKLSDANFNKIYPDAPERGNEYKFCKDQKIDAFLVLSISDFHGRFLFDADLFTVYTNSFSWQDSVIFSHNDLDEAVNELTQRLLVALSGNTPAALTVRVQPEEALILVNSSFAGRGELVSREYSGGTIIIDVSAPDYERLTLETVITEGEKLNLSLSLTPVHYGFLDITSSVQGSVYQGSLYAGETPLTLRIPYGSVEYIELETPGMSRAAVYQMSAESLISQSLSFDPVRPMETGRVDIDRRWYYWTWGGTWITGIAAWITYHTYVNRSYAYYANNIYNENFEKGNTRMYYASMGTAITFGLVAAYGVYRLVRYLITADRSASPAVRKGGS